MSEVPRRAVSRAVRLAALPAGIAARTASGLGRRLTGATAADVAQDAQERTAEQLFAVLGQLKGGAMKLGQAMSTLESALPEEMARPYRAALTRLQEAAPPMPRSSLYAVLEREMGRSWRRRFSEFDDEACAAASIGQVHKGTLADGRTVAVKVQYPGAAEALLGDFNQLARFARMSTSLMPGFDAKAVIAELKARVSEELDYRIEGDSQAQCAFVFAGDSDIYVPDVIRASRHVLITGWMDGTPLAQIIADGDQEQRDAAGSRYLEFLLRGPAEAGLIHADPHPGNFRLLEDGRLGVMDFGAIGRLPDGMPGAVGVLLAETLHDVPQVDVLVDTLRREGFIRPNIRVDGPELLEYLLPFTDPVRTERFAFSRAWLRMLFQHVNSPSRPQWMMGLKLNLPPEYVMIWRVWLGAIGVLCQLGSSVPVRNLFEEGLPGFDPPR